MAKTHKIVFQDRFGQYSHKAKGNSFSECIEKIHVHAADKKEIVCLAQGSQVSDVFEYLDDLGNCLFYKRIDGAWVEVSPEIYVI